MSISVIIVDDEIPAQKELAYLVSQVPGFTVAGVANSGEDALIMCRQVVPQVALVDIQLYDMDGLTLAQLIKEYIPKIQVIFATAHDQFAVQAFELHALDYIMKPFKYERVRDALERAREILLMTARTVDLKQLMELLSAEERPNKICAESKGKWQVIDSGDIVYVTADEGKTMIKLVNNFVPSSYTLQELAQRLDPKRFLRVHRAYLVNLDFVKELIPFFKSSYKLVMADKQVSEVPVSRNFARDLKTRLGICKSCSP